MVDGRVTGITSNVNNHVLLLMGSEMLAWMSVQGKQTSPLLLQHVTNSTRRIGADWHVKNSWPGRCSEGGPSQSRQIRAESDPKDKDDCSRRKGGANLIQWVHHSAFQPTGI